ncbi:MAG: hypothetical protein JSS66_00025 [Armatimonadetes bacterium]|nr:hypothetical protein [Armatimonadota bacterium]
MMSAYSAQGRVVVVVSLLALAAGAVVAFAQDVAGTARGSGSVSSTASASATARDQSAGTGQQGSVNGGGGVVSASCYAVVFSVKDKNDPSREWRDQMKNYADLLVSQSKLAADGEFADHSGYLWLIKAPNEDAAKEIVRAAPAVRAQKVTVDMKKWDGRFSYGNPASLGLIRR